MLTDAPPRKANRAGFLESDQTRTLDLTQEGSLLTITKSIESAIRRGRSTDVRRTCADFLKAASECYKVVDCGHPRPYCPTIASSRKLEHRAFRGLYSRSHADPHLDADGVRKEVTSFMVGRSFACFVSWRKSAVVKRSLTMASISSTTTTTISTPRVCWHFHSRWETHSVWLSLILQIRNRRRAFPVPHRAVTTLRRLRVRRI